MQLTKLSLVWALTCLALGANGDTPQETDATTGMELLQLKEKLTEADGALDEEDDDEEEDKDEAEAEEADFTPDTEYVPKTVCSEDSPQATSGGWWCPDVITKDWKPPKIPKKTSVKVTYAEAPISAFEKATENMPIKTNPLLHAGLIFEIPSTKNFKGRKIVLEMTAKNGMTNALLPAGVGQAGPIWNNDAVINFMDYSNETYWEFQTVVGFVRGGKVNKLMRWIRKKYMKSGANDDIQYESFNVWRSTGGQVKPDFVAPRKDFFLEDRVCDAFAETAIRYLIRKGLERPTKNAIPKRNFFVLVSQKAPQLMDPSKPEDLKAIATFYQVVQSAAAAAQTKDADAVQQVVMAARQNGNIAMAYSPGNGGYFKVELAPPYILNQYGPMRLNPKWTPHSLQ